MGYFVPDMRKLKEKKKLPKWSKVNVRTSRMNTLKSLSVKVQMSIPSCVDEALANWVRDVAPKRISIVKLSYGSDDER